MDWTRAIDAYCERTDPGFWAEPVNALTNAAFLVAALVMAWRLRGTQLALARPLVLLLALIGVGSFLFHTFAQPWAAMLDVLPIMVFALTYLYAASRHFLGLSRRAAAATVLAFLVVTALAMPLLSQLPLYGPSASYLTLPLVILLYAWLTRADAALSRGLVLGAGLLLVSLTFRSLDAPLCDSLALGTHFGWHVFNALMLGWMIELYRRHALAPSRRGR
ncbi:MULTISPECIES: ceramidase domain-containing protein [unclassified Roseovarius]|uniref:ceramidase domain-containing protein n=1 Tax=unclassified Roseovarius TaxID=2614913 RepID=UPI00273F17A0|nr:ceramidase domain-containing protein [Roseovarius sp. MMSF_3350]